MTFARGALAVMLSALVAAAAGCGTVVYGTSENIPVASDPAGARVIVDGKRVGDTPLTVKLSRKERHEIEIQKSGYITYKITTETSPNPGALVPDLIPAIVFPPIVLLGPGEYETGAGYKIVPDKINAHLLTAATASAPAAPVTTSASPATAAKQAATASPSAPSTPAATASASATPTPGASPSPAATPMPAATSH